MAQVAMSNPFETLSSTVCDYYNKAQEYYTQGEEQCIKLAKNVLPEQFHQLAEKVCKSIPETLFAASMITGQLKFAAVIYGGIKLAWAITPLVQQVFTGNIGREALTDALNGCIDRLKELEERFHPAIFVACAVGSAVSVLFGMLHFDPSLIITGGFLALLSRMGYELMQQRSSTPNEPFLFSDLVPTPTPLPTGVSAEASAPPLLGHEQT